MVFILILFLKVYNIEPTDVRNFVDRLSRAIECINSTLSCAPDFEEEVQKIPVLQCVHVMNFVGIGAVRYLPKFLRGVHLSPEVSQEVDNVNASLAKELAKTDPLYSEGTTTDGKICVCLGVETKPIDHNSRTQYTQLITGTIDRLGLKEIIEKKFGEIIAQGIASAEEHMRAENELAEVQQGIVRSIPVVGSVFNWFSPVEKKVHGKSFDIGSTSLKNVVLSPSAGTPTRESRSDSSSTPTTPMKASPPPKNPNTPGPTPTPIKTPEIISDKTPTKVEEKEEEEEGEDIPKPEPLPF